MASKIARISAFHPSSPVQSERRAAAATVANFQDNRNCAAAQAVTTAEVSSAYDGGLRDPNLTAAAVAARGNPATYTRPPDLIQVFGYVHYTREFTFARNLRSLDIWDWKCRSRIYAGGTMEYNVASSQIDISDDDIALIIHIVSVERDWVAVRYIKIYIYAEDERQLNRIGASNILFSTSFSAISLISG